MSLYKNIPFDRVGADFDPARNRTHQAQLFAALNDYFEKPEKSAEFKAALTAFSLAGDVPTEVSNILLKFGSTPGAYDNAYERLFTIRDYTGTRESGMRIGTMGPNAVTIQDISADGARMPISKIGASDTSVNFALYGGGVAWNRVDMEDRNFLALDEAVGEARDKMWKTRSDYFYALIEALTVTTYDIAFASPVPSTLANTDALYTANRDAQTINAAALAILTACKDIFPDVTANTPLTIIAPKALESRIEAALSLRVQAYGGSAPAVQYRLNPTIYTFGFTTNQTDYYVVLPGHKLLGGYRQNLRAESFTDVRSQTDGIAVTARWVGVLGEENQLRRCKTS